MRILQVLAGGEHGGAETAFVDACIAMHEAGEVVEVATRANDLRVPQLTNAGITVHTLPFGGKIDFWTGFRLKSIIKSFKPDIVQTWMSRASAHVPKWSKGMGIPQYLNVARLGGYYKLKYFKNIDYYYLVKHQQQHVLMKVDLLLYYYYYYYLLKLLYQLFFFVGMFVD